MHSARARRHPGLLLDVAAAGHELAVHGEGHLKYRDVSTRVKSMTILSMASPSVRLRLMRPPYGHWHEGVAAAAARAGLIPALWNTEAGDWDGTNSAMVMWKRTRASLTPGMVICLHDCFDKFDPHLRSNGTNTLVYVERLLSAAAARGLSAGTCSSPSTLKPVHVTSCASASALVSASASASATASATASVTASTSAPSGELDTAVLPNV